MGCPTRARPTGGGAYLIDGERQGEFWSMAVASPQYPAAVLLEPAAKSARWIAPSRSWWGPPREDIGAGDFHVLFTAIGPCVMVREEKTDGEGGLESPPERCYEVEPARSRYTVLSPGAAELWIRFNKSPQRPGRTRTPLGAPGRAT